MTYQLWHVLCWVQAPLKWASWNTGCKSINSGGMYLAKQDDAGAA